MGLEPTSGALRVRAHAPSNPDVALKLRRVLANNVRAERAKRGWRQVEFAERIGLSRTTVSDIESGNRRLDIEDLLLLCHVFGVKLVKLLEGADPKDIDALI